MKIVVAIKAVPDDQDILVAGDRSLDYSKAKSTVSTYDLNAMEVAAQLKDSIAGSSAVAMSAGPASADDSKLKKNVLARGIDELFMVCGDEYSNIDSLGTAQALSSLLETVGGYDLILCGDGSADNFSQQVDVQLAAKLGIPVVNAAKKITPVDGGIEVERVLEDFVETVFVTLPAVVSVVPDAATPRIPGMKDILAAGKKPANVSGVSESLPGGNEVVSCLAPVQMERQCDVKEASEEAIAEFVAALKAAL